MLLTKNHLAPCLTETSFNWGKKYRGKVRDIYDLGETLILVTTDRQSAFDRVLASVPYKGQVLNLTSTWWFEQTRSVIPNHVLSVPDPNVTVAKKCQVFPIEFVVRGYITGNTNTSLWTQYHQGNRTYCGHRLPEGLRKHQRLASPLITPTTKEAPHDRPVSPKEIIDGKLMTPDAWEAASDAAMRLYEFGVQVAARHGLILVDTKYEMGLDAEGNLTLVDEVHTPDSSRYWLSETYEQRFEQHEAPDSIDKDFLRLWFKDHCDPYHDPILPEAPKALVQTLSRRYIQLYEMIVGERFPFPEKDQNLLARIEQALGS